MPKPLYAKPRNREDIKDEGGRLRDLRRAGFKKIPKPYSKVKKAKRVGKPRKPWQPSQYV